MRGEHLKSPETGTVTVGSSPHARGARERRAPLARLEGIIPACAGSTLHDQRVWSPFSLNTFTFCKL